jgi:hypothetical protein
MLKNYHTFIKESQSKKISKYIDFSTFLKWYNDSRKKIAGIIGVDPEELANEEEILKQSSDLITKIINTQSNGNMGRDDISGFKSFKPLTNHIAHDILHNIYNVTKKNFDGYDEHDYSESENIEEIEVLAIEESLMKYFKMDYVKSDFVHQNINRLVGFLMLTIIRNEPERCVDILDGKIAPFVEVYDKEYLVKGTPFENLYEMLHQIPIDPVRSDKKIETGQDFKDWLGYMALYGDAIDSADNGDRADFPNSSFLGQKQFHDLTDEEMINFLSSSYYLYDTSDLDGLNLNDDYEYCTDKLVSVYSDLPININDVYKLDEKLKEIPHEIKKQLESVNDKYKLEGVYEVDASEDNYNLFSSESVYLAILNRNDGPLYITYDGEFEELDEKYSIYEVVDVGRILVNEDTAREGFWDVQWDYIVDIEEEIDYNHHTDDLDRNIQSMKYSDNILAITRRYFRYNDVLVNNTKIDTPSKNYQYVQNSLFDDYKSLSKSPLTDNAKRLVRIFDEFRGWTIKNFDMLKKTSKKMKKVFEKGDLELLSNFNKNLKIIKTGIYENTTLDILNDGKPFVELPYDDIIKCFRDNGETGKAIDLFQEYKNLFNRFDDERIFDYLKRVPKIDIDQVKNDLNRFNDMFTDKFVEDYKRYKGHFNSIANIGHDEINEYFVLEFDEAQKYDHSISRLKIPYKESGKLFDVIDKFVSSKLKGTQLVRDGLDVIEKNGIIDRIKNANDSYGDIYYYTKITHLTYKFPNIR